jgi:cell division septal protein FtsQ
MSTSQPPTTRKTQPAARPANKGAAQSIGTRPQTPRAGASAPSARRRAKRRQAIGNRLHRFETTLPGLRMAPMRSPAMPMSTIGFTGFVWSKIISLALVIGVLLSLIWINGDERWYVYPERIQITGARLVDAQLLSNAAEVSGWNIFWLRQSEVRNRILQNPWVDGATVTFGVPAEVRVAVTEAPAIGVWATNAGEYWISPTGAALPMTGTAAPDMARLIDPQMAAARPGSAPGQAVDTNIVASALALMENVPGVTEVRYSPDVGLHFGLPGTTLYVHWGDGEELEQKLDMLNLGRQLAATGELNGQILDVRFPDVVTTR